MMRFLQLTMANSVELRDERRLFHLWVDAARVVAVLPRFRKETWGGRTYSIPDGTHIQLDGGEFVEVAESAETVVAALIEESA